MVGQFPDIGGNGASWNTNRSGRRRRLIGVAVALAVLTVCAGLPQALADPEDDKRRVERQIDGAKSDLDDSSAHLVAAIRAASSAQKALATARTRLAAARGKLAAARAKDAAMAAQLADARRAVSAAVAAETRAEERLEAQVGEIAAFANASYQGSRAAEISAVLKSKNITDLLSAAQIVASVSDSQRTAMDRLDAARVALAGRRDARVTAEQAVQAHRQLAAENLDRMRQLERQARSAEAAVRQLVDERQAAKAAAERAKREDTRRYKALVAERERIERILREQAERDRAGGGGGSVGDLIRPVDAPITSQYGMRFHPVLRVWKLHDGTDFGASCGTPIRAAASGTVMSRYYNEGYGNRVLVSHGLIDGDSIVTAYNHLSSYAVSSGERVSQGEIVGYVGSTGYSTGCHLHFMVYRDGDTVDPMDYL
ncbi:peptidoglycan DD-metalloendopeptidase family protein [Actinopolymorpha sp. B17G11]|uniref:peptidoglycan DD-metalloendopeptidase family protein n=1 Tax=Actinopolymorpha sp. B17G11 TaxID=3160861 RepID=UPI0032E52053